MSGFITLHREATEHPLFREDMARLGAWVWMIGKACWKPTRFDVGGKIVTLERGQFCCSVREMAKAWGWSKSAADRFIQRLSDENMVILTRSKTGTDSGTGRNIVTICNYSKYQDQSNDCGTPTGTAAGQQRDIKEQGNKGTKEQGITANAVIGDFDADSGDEKPPRSPTPSDPDETTSEASSLRPDHVVAVWNDLASRIDRPKVRELTPERRVRLKARIRHYSLDDFTEAIAKVEASPFLRGDRKWQGVTFDWFIKKQNFLKILEGNYDD